jgi:hypothetical protein
MPGLLLLVWAGQYCTLENTEYSKFVTDILRLTLKRMSADLPQTKQRAPPSQLVWTARQGRVENYCSPCHLLDNLAGQERI